jgi:tetratricopeptide (TPR) repeat protein
MYRDRITSPVGARFRALTNCLLLITVWANLVAHPLAAQGQLTDSDERSLKLVAKLAAAPNLIAYDYLVSVLGLPNRVSVLPGGLARQAEWYELGTNQLRYRFQQEFGLLVQGGDVRNHFELIFHDGVRIDLHELAKRLDSSCMTHFNDRGYLTGVYKVTPNTTLEACQPNNYRALSEISISYVGTNLPPPRQTEILQALQVRRAEAFEQHVNGYHAKAAPLLSAYLRDFPNDAEAHLKLADSYKACGCLNQAINQYSLAYALSDTDSQIRRAAAQELKALNVCPFTPLDQNACATIDPALAKPARPRSTAVGADRDDPFNVEMIDSKISPRPKSIAASARPIDAGF